MICPNCGKRVRVSDKYMKSLESYKPGGSLLITTPCCGTISRLQMFISFDLFPYDGDEDTDAFGIKKKI